MTIWLAESPVFTLSRVSEDLKGFLISVILTVVILLGYILVIYKAAEAFEVVHVLFPILNLLQGKE